MTMQTWDHERPWDVVRTYGASYKKNGGSLSDSEILNMPKLILLRAAVNIFLRLEKINVLQDHENTIRAIEYLKNAFLWMKRNREEFVEVLRGSF